jgi:hypothetical protein
MAEETLSTALSSNPWKRSQRRGTLVVRKFTACPMWIELHGRCDARRSIAPTQRLAEQLAAMLQVRLLMR